VAQNRPHLDDAGVANAGVGIVTEYNGDVFRGGSLSNRATLNQEGHVRVYTVMASVPRGMDLAVRALA